MDKTIESLQMRVLPLFKERSDSAEFYSMLVHFIDLLENAPIPLLASDYCYDVAIPRIPQNSVRVWFRPRAFGLAAYDNYVIVLDLEYDLVTKVANIRVLRGHKNAEGKYITHITDYTGPKPVIYNLVDQAFVHLQVLYSTPT